jgi:hypothetical protein
MADVAAVGADGSAALQAKGQRGRLAALAVALAAGAAALYVVAVRLGWGQRLDEAMKAWWLPVRADAQSAARALARLSAAPLAVTTLVTSCVVVARRRRLDLVPALLAVVVGGPALVQVLKHEVLTREVLVEGTFPASNTLPSGHGAVLATAGVVALWLAPSGRRALALVAAAAFVAAGVVLILVAALHRPSDVAAAFLVVGGWSAAVLALETLDAAPGSSDPGPTEAGPPDRGPIPGGGILHRAVAGVLLVAAVLAAGGLGVAVAAVGDRRDADSTTLAVFTGGCCLVAAVALTTVAALAWAMGGGVVSARPGQADAQSDSGGSGPAQA